MNQFLLGIDLGTSSVKVALVDPQTLNVPAKASVEYKIYHPQRDFAEQSPEDWWDATIRAVRAVMQQVGNKPEILGIGLSGQMHGLVCLDSQFQPVQDAIIWADGRSHKQVEQLKELQAKTTSTMPGLPASGFAASSALWLKQNEPEVLEQTAQWCLPKDYIKLRLTGTLSTEPSDAASSWLYDVAQQTWAKDVYQYCGLDARQMPSIVASDSVDGALTKDSADALGLEANIPVVAGSADLPAQALGHGITTTDTILMTVGTGGQVFVPHDSPEIDPDNRYYVFNNNQPDTWYVQTAILSGGASLRWLRDVLQLSDEQDAYGKLSTMAESISEGADGLLFLPYLAGERSPHMDSQASGMFLGLRLNHTRAHLARAVMEGVAFALRDCLSFVPNTSQRIILSGGITQSNTWSQILADILGVRLMTVQSEQPNGAVGAAILAGSGIGLFEEISELAVGLAENLNSVNPNHASVYEERFEQYQRLYPLLKAEMHQLSKA